MYASPPLILETAHRAAALVRRNRIAVGIPCNSATRRLCPAPFAHRAAYAVAYAWLAELVRD